ncbi:hypothetical protein V6N13_000202 [Hibiscus sabdariffa]
MPFSCSVELLASPAIQLLFGVLRKVSISMVQFFGFAKRLRTCWLIIGISRATDLISQIRRILWLSFKRSIVCPGLCCRLLGDVSLVQKGVWVFVSNAIGGMEVYGFPTVMGVLL